jgi:hypothetical protein
MRALCLALALSLAAGCASGGNRPKRTVPAVILGVLMVGGGAVAVGAAAKSQSIEKKLGDDYNQRDIGGREFASRDAEGQRWNRVARGATFVSALSLLGLAVLCEMAAGDRAQYEAPKPPSNAPIYNPSLPPAAAFPAPAPNHMSATASVNLLLR